MSSDLSRLFKRAVLKTVTSEGIPAKLGKADGATLFYVDDAGTHHKDRVWARIGAGTAPAEAVVRCVSVPQTLNLPVIVADRDGVLTVIRTDTNRAVEWSDGQLIDVAPHNWTHGRYGSDALYITGLSFLPLAAYPSDPPDLTVEVEQCFYRYQNTHKVFERTTSDSLSAYRPAGTTVTHYVILALDRSTNALAVIDGDDVSGGNRVLPSASTVLATSGLRSEHFPICAIRLYNAQTQIFPRDIFMDLRLWAGESSASGSGSSGSATVLGPNTSTDHAIARWDGTDGTLLQDSYPTIDDSGNVDLQGNELRDYSHQMIEANTGAAYEIDWSAAGIFELTLTDDPTFTFVNESAGRAVTLILIQDGVGGRTVTWPGGIDWPNTIEPTLFSGAGDVDIITLICRNDGSTVSGFATSDVRTNQGNTFTVGSQIIQTDPDTVTAFQVFDADGGNPVLSVDTVNGRIGINPAGNWASMLSVGNIAVADSGAQIHAQGRIRSNSSIQVGTAMVMTSTTLSYVSVNRCKIEGYYQGTGGARSWNIQAGTAANTDGEIKCTIDDVMKVFIDDDQIQLLNPVVASGPTVVPLTIKLAPAQSEDAFQVQKSDGTVLSGADERGILFSDGGTDVDNVLLGANAGNIGVMSGDNNIWIGADAGASATTLNNSVLIGTRAGTTYTAGAFNFCLGTFAGRLAIAGSSNVFIGYSAGYNATYGDHNVLIGNNAGLGISGGGGDFNVCIGSETGRSLGINDAGSVMIGYSAGRNETNANRLYIANSDTATPLIYGEFPNTTLILGSPVTIGIGGAGIDYTLTFGGETNDGVITWKEDEDWFDFSDTVKTSAGRIKSTARIDDGDSPYTTTNVDDVIFADTDGGVITVNLQAGVEGRRLRIVNVGTGGNDVTIDGDGAETVMGATTQTMSDGEIVILVYNATEGWW